jgi:hypothetical protein
MVCRPAARGPEQRPQAGESIGRCESGRHQRSDRRSQLIRVEHTGGCEITEKRRATGAEDRRDPAGLLAEGRLFLHDPQ